MSRPNPSPRPSPKPSPQSNATASHLPPLPASGFPSLDRILTELPNPDPGEAAVSARNSVVDIPPKLTLIRPNEHKTQPWKNGLGTTKEIAIHPPNVDYHKDDFNWRFSLSEVKDTCSFSLFPGYDIALTLLPEDGANVMMRGNMTAPAVLHHNDQELSVPIRPLVPYTYGGETPTSCRVRTPPIRHLTFLANRAMLQVRPHFLLTSLNLICDEKVSVNLETICPHGLSDDGICDGDGDATTPIPSPHLSKVKIDPTSGKAESRSPLLQKAHFQASHHSHSHVSPTRKILLAPFTIVYVVSGTIRVAVDSGEEAVTVSPGETLVCERHDEAAPTDFAMTPVSPSGSGNKKKFDVDLSVPGGRLEENVDATIVVIQIHFKPRIERNSSLYLDNGMVTPTSATSSTAPGLPRQHRGRAGSIIVYDDQPLWNLPREMDSQVSLEGTMAGNSNLGVKYWDSAKHYRPPIFSARYQNESEVPPPVVRDNLVIEEFEVGKISTAWINMLKQGLSEWLRIPVIIARGVKEGPVVGITAVVHGNELNGVPCIHRVITDIDVNHLCGTVVAVPCVNVPGYLRFSREFSDGKDLNRVFPGAESGTASQVYAHCILNKIVAHFDYLIDLHTASFGRVNSYYVRSDLNDPISATLAKLQQPQIILHNSGQDGTLRSAASARGIKAITVEIGNPQLFQNQYVQWSYLGVMRILAYLNMFSSSHFPPPEDAMAMDGGVDGQPDLAGLALYPPPPNTIICSKGFWIYTKTGGVLEVYPGVNTVVRKGDLIARIKNIFGNIVDEIYCPSHGVTIGRSSNPVAMAGDRVLHLGIIKRENEVLPKEAKENY
ncbi:hypothetical protein HDU97_004024 [Phlyctochytrium planicorne]|nr:hypothetical protein HDU97_004024 [Phlyctochytrium planicorne]